MPLLRLLRGKSRTLRNMNHWAGAGMLIDVDLAMKVKEDGTDERSEAQQMTGIPECRAIEVLEKALPEVMRDLDHTYRHDLESFAYVLLSVCMRFGWGRGKVTKEDPLRSWYSGIYEDIARAKNGTWEPVVLKNTS